MERATFAAMFRDLRPPVLFALASVYFIWGSTYFAMRVAFAEMPQLMGSGSRYVVAGLILIVFLKLRGAPWPTARQWLLALPVGSLMFVCGNGMVAIAGRTIGSGIIAVVCATTPLFLAACAMLFGEKQTRGEWLAMIVGLFGVALLARGSELSAQPGMFALLMLAPAGWALGSMLAKHWPLAPGLMSAATQMLAGGAVMMFLGAVFHGESLPTHVPGVVILAYAWLVIGGSLIGFTAYSYLLKTVRPALATSYAYVNPAIAVLIGAGVGHEVIAGAAWVATAVIIGAVVLSIRQRTASA